MFYKVIHGLMFRLCEPSSCHFLVLSEFYIRPEHLTREWEENDDEEVLVCHPKAFLCHWSHILYHINEELRRHIHRKYRDLVVRLRLKCDGTRAETRFRLSAKRTSPFKSAGGRSVQSITGSRGVRINSSNGSNAGYTMFRGSVKGTGYPLHSPVSPSLPLQCVTVCHHISAGLYLVLLRESLAVFLAHMLTIQTHFRQSLSLDE